MSAFGTKRTSSDVRLESALTGKADCMCSQRVFRLLTPSGHGVTAPRVLLSLPLGRKMLTLAPSRLWEGAMAYQGTLSWPMARAMATRPNAEAIVDGETRLTYAQWGRRVRGLTGGLRSLGLRTGDVVASIGQNSFRHLECSVGIPTAGMGLHDLNHPPAHPEPEFLINDCERRTLFALGADLGGLRQVN